MAWAFEQSAQVDIDVLAGQIDFGGLQTPAAPTNCHLPGCRCAPNATPPEPPEPLYGLEGIARYEAIRDP